MVAVTGFIAFGAVAGVWWGLLSYKYGGFTTGSAGAYNYALIGPASTHGNPESPWPGVPMHARGFLAPPHAGAVSAFEDPTYLAVPKWSPWATGANFRYQLKLVAHNIQNLGGVLLWYSWLSIAILAISALVVGCSPQAKARRPLSLLVLAVALYPLGYLLIFLEQRFLSVMAVILLILGIFLIDALDVRRLGRWGRLAVTAFICASFLVRPVGALWRHRGAGSDTAQIAGHVAAVVPAGGSLASAFGSRRQWGEALHIAFYDGLTYFGESKPGASEAQVLADLRLNQIDYFLVWGDSQQFTFTGELPEISQGRVVGLRIYRVGPRTGPSGKSGRI